MDTREDDQTPQQEFSGPRERRSKPVVLPCGSRVCLRCHKGCGVVMAAYLSGLDELETTGDEGS